MSANNENNPCVTVVPLGTVATDNTQLPAMHFPKKSKLKSVKIIDGLGVAASDSNYIQVSLLNAVGDAVVAELDSRAAHEGALTARVAKALNIAEDDMAEGTSLYFDYQETGTVTLTNAILVIEHFPL